MRYVKIKGHDAEGLVAVETYDTDTNGVGGFAVKVPDLWRWLWECRPCQVRVRGRVYWLQPTARVARPVPNGTMRMSS